MSYKIADREEGTDVASVTYHSYTLKPAPECVKEQLQLHLIPMRDADRDKSCGTLPKAEQDTPSSNNAHSSAIELVVFDSSVSALEAVSEFTERLLRSHWG